MPIVWAPRYPESSFSGSKSQFTPWKENVSGDMCAPTSVRTCTLSPAYARSSGVYGSVGFAPVNGRGYPTIGSREQLATPFAVTQCWPPEQMMAEQSFGSGGLMFVPCGGWTLTCESARTMER